MFCCMGYVFTHVMLSLTILFVSFIWSETFKPSDYAALIFAVGCLLIKKSTMCGAAMCTFPIHSVKHPIVFKHSEINNDSKSSLLHIDAGKHIISDLFASTFVYQTASRTDNKKRQENYQNDKTFPFIQM